MSSWSTFHRVHDQNLPIHKYRVVYVQRESVSRRNSGTTRPRTAVVPIVCSFAVADAVRWLRPRNWTHQTPGWKMVSLFVKASLLLGGIKTRLCCRGRCEMTAIAKLNFWASDWKTVLVPADGRLLIDGGRDLSHLWRYGNAWRGHKSGKGIRLPLRVVVLPTSCGGNPNVQASLPTYALSCGRALAKDNP